MVVLNVDCSQQYLIITYNKTNSILKIAFIMY